MNDRYACPKNCKFFRVLLLFYFLCYGKDIRGPLTGENKIGAYIMHLEYSENEMKELMKDFFLLTGIRIVLFDQNYHELLSYPETHCRFCQMMKNNNATRKQCDESDRTSFQTCQKEKRLIIYHCHAGLIEAAAPLMDNKAVIGYMMFGQISDATDSGKLAEILSRYSGLYNKDAAAIPSLTEDIPLKTSDQIQAAAKIMEACTFYLILKNTIRVRRDNFIRNMDQYILEHISENLSVENITNFFGVSKSRLYEAYDLYYGCGIAEHIRSLRIDEAKRLLRDTDLPVTKISDMVGFSDYNYFCRSFKKYAGVPAKKYRDI